MLGEGSDVLDIVLLVAEYRRLHRRLAAGDGLSYDERTRLKGLHNLMLEPEAHEGDASVQRRRFARMPVRLQGLLLHSTDGHNQVISVDDMGADGAAVRGEGPLALDDRVRLVFFSGDLGKRIAFEGRIVWMERTGSEFRAGMQFFERGRPQVREPMQEAPRDHGAIRDPLLRWIQTRGATA